MVDVSGFPQVLIFLLRRLVPALNVISDYYNIPDDIAGELKELSYTSISSFHSLPLCDLTQSKLLHSGATLMASGASSPELLCTLVSLFITHSSLGLGTIVGSEIFNLLIICAGSVYASKVHQVPHERYGNRYLVLDKVMVCREVMFYGLSIAILYVALSESGPVMVQDEKNGGQEVEEDRIIVFFWKAMLVFGVYVLYVWVCANMSKIMGLCGNVKRCLGIGSESTVEDTVQSTEGGGDGAVYGLSSSIHYKVRGNCLEFFFDATSLDLTFYSLWHQELCR
jgi:Ca2+/Na+ antiporter